MVITEPMERWILNGQSNAAPKPFFVHVTQHIEVYDAFIFNPFYAWVKVEICKTNTRYLNGENNKYSLWLLFFKESVAVHFVRVFHWRLQYFTVLCMKMNHFWVVFYKCEPLSYDAFKDLLESCCSHCAQRRSRWPLTFVGGSGSTILFFGWGNDGYFLFISFTSVLMRNK